VNNGTTRGTNARGGKQTPWMDRGGVNKKRKKNENLNDDFP